MTGAAIMIVEILGAKMLSPYLGTSHFVWTAQIAVTLVALACGYYAGGRLVDRASNPGWLYGAILAAGLWLALTIALVEPVAYRCLEFSLPTGSLLASAFLFFVPLGLLATVGPFAVRMLTRSLAGVGGSMGRLTALSTLGSFAGTVLIGYVLIPHLPNSRTMYFTAAVLMALGVAYFAGWGRGGAARVMPLLLAAGGAFLGHGGLARERWAGGDLEELHRSNSNFGLLQVLQRKGGTYRAYLNDYLTQNTYDAAQKKSTSMFTYLLHGLARAYTVETRDVLCIGLGVGIVPMQFAREGARVEAVEINPEVVPVAKNFFDFEPDRVTLHLGDGRQFINRCPRQFDAVVLDAFLGDSCPSHLMTREAFAAMKRLLRPGGVLVMNTFGDFTEGRDFLTASLYKTLTNVFPGVRIHSGVNGNTFFVATPREAPTMLRAPELDGVYAGAVQLVQSAYETVRETDPARGLVLTDDFNPVEFHDAANRETLRRALAISMKTREP